MIQSSSKFNFISIFLIIFIGFIIYVNALHGEFQFDDYPYIVNNPSIQNIHDLKSIWDFRESRVVTMISFALNYHFHQLNTFGYHLINVIIHIYSALLIRWLILLIFQSPKIKNTSLKTHKNEIALVASLLFLTHPINTQAVTYITQRFTSLASMLYILSLCFYASAHLTQKQLTARIQIILVFITGFLSMLCKELPITLPITILIYHHFFIERISIKNLINSNRKKLFLLIILLSICMVPFMYTKAYNVKPWDFDYIFQPVVSHSYEGEIVNFQNYYLTQFRVVCRYIQLLLIPIGQNFDYHFSVSTSLFSPITTFISFVFLVFLLLSSFYCAQKERTIMAFGLMWFFIALSLESSFFPIRNVIFEHRAYLPSAGFLIFLTIFLFRLSKNIRIFRIISILLICICSILTIQRNNIWKTQISFWSDVIKKSPLKGRPYLNLGAAYMGSGEYLKAIESLKKSLSLEPQTVEPYNNLGSVYIALDRPDEAIEILLKGNKIEKNNVGILNNLGTAYKKKRNLPKAKEYYRKAAQLNSVFLEPIYNLIELYKEEKNFPEAIHLAEQVYQQYPHQTHSLYILPSLYFQNQQTEKAQDIAIDILKKCKNTETLRNLGILYAQNNQPKIAITLFLKALKLEPNNPETLKELGKFYANAQKFNEAILLWKRGMSYSSNKSEFTQLIEKAENLKNSSQP